MSAQTSGSLDATGSVTLDKPQHDTLTLVQISGTYGTVQFVFEGSADTEEFFPVAAIRYDTGAVVNGTISPTDNAEQAWKVPSEGLLKLRARVTAIGSGAAEFYFNSASYTGLPFISQQSTGGSVGAQSFTGLITATAGITFDGATGENDLTIPDNLANALTIQEGSNAYVTIITTDLGERIAVFKQVRLADSVKLALGDADDLTIAWDGTDCDVLQATANSSISWGIDGAGIDQVWYGDTASTNMTWDQSADSLIFNGAARVVFTGTTGQPEVHLTDNLADALSIEISGSTDLLVFTTTNNAESVSPIGLRTRSTTAVAITGATTLTLADSGGIFTVGQGSAYDVDLPSPTSGPGCTYFFSVTAPGANNVTITVTGSAATFVGSLITEGQIIVATGSTLTIASGVAVLGDSIEIRSIATNLYHVRAVSAILNGITVA